MEVVNATPYAFLPFDCTPTPAMPALSLIVKGAFKLRPGQPAQALDKNDQPQFMGDDMHMDDLGRSLRYSSDLVAMKLRGEVLVSAVCHAPEGRARTALDVAIAIGAIHKTLRVTGDRTWSQSSGGLPIVTRTLPFESMPIRWERAFGGLSYAQNPLGRGIDAVPDDRGAPIRSLPNVEYFDKRVTDPKDRPPPAGFGPTSPTWNPRLTRQGTRDQRWAMFRAPLPPQDFDPRFYNAAPEDQQLPEGFFRGDETLTLTGLHKELPVYEAALPGKRLRLFMLMRRPSQEAAPGAPGAAPVRFREVKPKLDTVHVDAETETLTLVWRQPVKVKSRAHPEIEAVYLAEEALAEGPLPREAHFARFEELRGPQAPPMSEAVQKEADAQLLEAKRILADGKVDPAVVKEIEGMKDPQRIFDTLMRFAQEKVKELEALTESLKRPPT